MTLADKTLSSPEISIVIPTYRREKVLLDTIDHLLKLRPAYSEILVIDQTQDHEATTVKALGKHEAAGNIRYIHLQRPSITHAMNVGLQRASNDVILFVDDDIIPHPSLVAAHIKAHEATHRIVAGQVLQPNEEPSVVDSGSFRFSSNKPQFVTELMGGNFSINRKLAIALGGFDENFVHVAYRFEAEFAQRALTAGEQIFFEPGASIQHLKASDGGTRSFGHHLTTIKPSHTVGAYYYLLSARNVHGRLSKLLNRPLSAVRTKHHARHPWWIPATLVSETLGFVWAVLLCLRGPRLIRES